MKDTSKLQGEEYNAYALLQNTEENLLDADAAAFFEQMASPDGIASLNEYFDEVEKSNQ